MMKPLATSRYQKRFFNIWKNSPTNIVNNLQYVFELSGNLDIQILKKACSLVLSQNEVFHARFEISGKICFYGDYQIDSIFKIISQPDNHQLELERILYYPLDLCQDPLLQFYLVQHSPKNDTYYFIIKSHHIVIDGGCARSITKFIADTYNSFVTNTALATKFASYTEYIKIEQLQQNNFDLEQSKLFWKNFAADIPLFVKLPHITIPQRKLHPVEQVFFSIKSETVKTLKSTAIKYNSTVFVVIAALYGKLLSNVSEQKKFMVTYPINMRPKTCMTVAGSFINNIFFKFDFAHNPSLEELIADLEQQRSATTKHKNMLFMDILELLNRGENDYINTGIVQGNINLEPLDMIQVKSVPQPTFTKSLSYQIRLVYDQQLNGEITFRLDYATDEISIEFAHEFMAKLHKNLLAIQDIH